jgi:hypothetical protein
MVVNIIMLVAQKYALIRWIVYASKILNDTTIQFYIYAFARYGCAYIS